MSASRVWLSTVVRPMNQERSMTMRRMPFSRTTTGASPRSWGRRRTLYLHGPALGRRAVSTLCALLLLAGGATRAAAQTPPPPVTPTSPVSSSAVAGYVMAFDPQVVSGAPAGLSEEHVEDAGTAGEIVEFYGYDAIGSVRMVFDPAGTVVGEATYSPFGIELAGTTGMPSQRFTGQERDHEAQLDYFNARSFQSRTGRFSSPDPVWAGGGDPQRWNRYAYALNSPLMMTDTTGLKADFSITVVGCESCVGMLHETMMSYFFRGLFGGGGGDNSGGGYYNSGDYSWPIIVPPLPVTTLPVGPTCPGDPGCGTPIPPPTPPPGPRPPEKEKEKESRRVEKHDPTVFESLVVCADEHYDLGGSLIRAGSWVGGVPIPKRMVGLPVVGTASRSTNLFRYAVHEIPQPRVTNNLVRRLGTLRALTVLGRANAVVGWAFAAYDAASIGYCMVKY